jgi:hypothetical protein
MTDKPARLITKDFFDPIFTHELGRSRPFSVYLAHCDREGLAMAAMTRARDAGRLHPLPVSDDRDFAEGKAWNSFCENGTATTGQRFLASSVLLERVDDFVGATIGKFTDNHGENIKDMDAFRNALTPLARKIELWMTEPQQFTQKNKLPRGTGFTDRSEAHYCTQYLMQMNGWSDMTLLEKPLNQDWQTVPAEPGLQSEDTPSPF